MNKSYIATGLNIVVWAAFFGAIYYLIPDQSHLFTDGPGFQLTASFLCIITSLVASMISEQLSPKKPTLCPHCGKPTDQKPKRPTKDDVDPLPSDEMRRESHFIGRER